MELEITVCARCGSPQYDHAWAGHAYEPGGKRKIYTQPREAEFRDHRLNPAAELYVTLEDKFRLTVINSMVGIEIDVGMRIQLPDGQIIPMSFQVFPVGTRTVQTFDFGLAEGFLLSISASTPTAAARKGQCFVNLSLIRGSGTNAIDLADLTEGYVVTGNDVGWPWPDAGYSVDGAGLVKSTNVANPAAGADWQTQVPAGARWQLQSISAQLVTAAAVANRAVHFQLANNAGVVYFDIPASGFQVAALTNRYTWAAGNPSTSFDSSFVANIPAGVQLLQGFFVGTVTTGIQAGDQWQNIQASFIEWMEP